MKALNVIAGLVVVAAGAGLYILLSNEKNENARKDISRSIKDLSKKIDRLAVRAEGDIRNLSRKLGKEVNGFAEETKKRIKDIYDESAMVTEQLYRKNGHHIS